MFRELVEAYERFRSEDKLPPVAYKPKDVIWVIELSGKEPYLSGPYGRGKFRRVFAPDRQRSGTPAPGNLKPFLLVDKAQYALGIAPKGKEGETTLVHGSFVDLLDLAWRTTNDQEIKAILEFTKKPPESLIKRIQPDDLVALRVDPTVFPFERPHVQQFWADYLAQEIQTDRDGACGVCGASRPLLRILPRELVVMGQKCQVTSFNLSAFTSFGREQTENSPLCFDCANAVVDALDYLIRSPLHSAVILDRRDPGGRLDPFHSQLAVYWLSRPVEISVGEVSIDFEEAFRAILSQRPPAPQAPSPDLKQIENLLKVPWVPKDHALDIAAESFHLAILSANRGRLVVRDWFSVSLADLRDRLGQFLAALRLVSLRGDDARARSIAAILEALPSGDPNLPQALLRTAYLGHPPPSSLLPSAVNRLRILWQEGRRDRPDQEAQRIRHIEALTSAIKLAQTYGKEVNAMDQLDTGRKSAPYLCGRLLAILEEAQQRASNWSLNRTIVDRFYGSASTAPCSVFGSLIRLATTAHLPEVGRDVNVLMEEVMRDLDVAGGFPSTLTAAQQAEFALGFYHQRADFRSQRRSSQQS